MLLTVGSMVVSATFLSVLLLLLLLYLCVCVCLNISLTRKKITPWFLDWIASGSTISIVWWVSRGLFSLLKWHIKFVFVYSCNTVVVFSGKELWFSLGSQKVCDAKGLGIAALTEIASSSAGGSRGPSMCWKGASLNVLTVWDEQNCQLGRLAGLVLQKAAKPTCRWTWWEFSLAPFILASLSCLCNEKVGSRFLSLWIKLNIHFGFKMILH